MHRIEVALSSVDPSALVAGTTNLFAAARHAIEGQRETAAPYGPTATV
jgi:hypothetical protein